MAIIINGKRYSSPSELQEVFARLKGVPQPTISSKDEAKITDEEVVLCLQPESVYIQKKAPKKYVGTKSLQTCLMVYIYSDDDLFAIHCDEIDTYDLHQAIGQFKNQTNIRVAILGGKTDLNDEQDSSRKRIADKNLHTLLTHLLKIDAEVTLECQMVSGDKALQKVDNRQFDREAILDKAALFFRRCFKKPLDLDKCQQAPNPLQPIPTGSLANIGNALFAINAFGSTKPMAIFAEKFFDQTKMKGEDNFYQCVRLLLQKEGQQFFKPARPFVFPTFNFIFNHHNGTIIPISEYTKTPDEIIRRLRTSDFGSASTYHSCYDSDKDTYLVPKISKEVEGVCMKLFSAMMKGAADYETLLNVISTENRFKYGKTEQLINHLTTYAIILEDIKKGKALHKEAIGLYKDEKFVDAKEAFKKIIDHFSQSQSIHLSSEAATMLTNARKNLAATRKKLGETSENEENKAEKTALDKSSTSPSCK